MGTQLQLIDKSLPIGNLDAYICRVNAIPMLTDEEEASLATRLLQNNDLEAARRMVMSHLRFVVKIAKGYLGYGLALGDLIQEGNVGLMKAVKRFDPKVGVRLVSYAVHWIKAEIHEFILKNWRIVKIATTKPQRKLFFNLRNAKKRLGWFTKEEVADVAQTLKVKPETVLQMEARLNAYDAPFDGYENDDDENGFSSSPSKTLEDNSHNPAPLLEASNSQSDSHDRLYCAFEKLDGRSKTILSKRWLTEKKETLQNLADKYNISAERVRQLEAMALGKLKSMIEKEQTE